MNDYQVRTRLPNNPQTSEALKDSSSCMGSAARILLLEEPLFGSYKTTTNGCSANMRDAGGC
jgi:hypothetical protein